MPIHAAAGLAHGMVLLDPDGEGARVQSRLRQPPPSLVVAVRAQLAAMVPDYVDELERCTARGDHWLHQNLSGQLLKVVYIGWFLAEGHLPPFPKRLPAWFARLGMDPAVVELERACWAAGSMTSSTDAVAALAELVLDRLRTAPLARPGPP